MAEPLPFASLGELVEDLSVRCPEDPAFRVAGRVFRRGEVAVHARALASGWRAAGYAEGDVVGIAGDGGPVFALALLSAARAGLVPLLLDPRLTADESRIVFERARPKAVALCAAVGWAVPSGVPELMFDPAGCVDLTEAGTGLEALPVVHDPHAPAVLIVTSGTSGCPRVVTLSARNVSSNIRAGFDAQPCGHDEVSLSLLPATHAFELTTGLLGPLSCCVPVVFPGSRNPNRLVQLVIAEGVTRVNVVPALLRMMVDEIRDAADGAGIVNALRQQLRSIICGGAPIAPDLVRTLVAHRLPLWLGYGLTEASPVVAVGRADQLPPGSTGRALPGVEVRIDAKTGELLVRGPNVMQGYAGEPGATAAVIQDGWLHTGDVARLDRGGYVFIVGRLRDVIVTSGGLKLAPETVEAAYRSPLFAEVCAVGVPDAAGGGGEKPHLAVVPSSGSGADATALGAEFHRLSIAAAGCSTFGMTVFTAPLPRTRTLKLRRDLVTRAVLARLDHPRGAR